MDKLEGNNYLIKANHSIRGKNYINLAEAVIMQVNEDNHIKSRDFTDCTLYLELIGLTSIAVVEPITLELK